MYLKQLSAQSVPMEILEPDGSGGTAIQVYDLQHFSGNLYMGPDTSGKHSDEFVRIYRYLPSLEIGYSLGLHYCDGQRVADDLARVFNRIEDESDFLDDVKKQMLNGKQIDIVKIELVRRCSPKMADECVIHNHTIIQRKEQERQKELSMTDEERAAARKAERLEEIRAGNAKTQEIVNAAITKMLEGGVFTNEEIRVYSLDRWGYASYRTYALINHLARLYGVTIPIRTQGWIAKHLWRVDVEGGEVVQCWRHPGSKTRGSVSFWGCINNLIAAVIESESENKSA